MRNSFRPALAFAACVILLTGLRSLAQESADSLVVKCTQNTQAIQAFEVLELIFQHVGKYADPFHDVNIDVTFTSPTGKAFKVGGFHYGSLEKPTVRQAPAGGKGGTKVQYLFAKQDIWKARFAPNEVGEWTWTYAFRNNTGALASGSGSFLCVLGRVPNHGFLRQDPKNPFCWVFDDGSPFYPMGLQECLGDSQGLGTTMASLAMEGPYRTDRTGRPELPSGAMFQPGPSGNPVNGDVYLRRYARCGFNLFRFSQQNCSFSLNDGLERYAVSEALMTDELLQYCRKYNYRIMYGIFGYQNVFNEDPNNAEGMEKVKRFIKYSVDRWGAYVDIWEFLNEQKASEGWYKIVIPYLQSIDPYHHPITTSWERPELAGIDINAPHWYVEGDGLAAASTVGPMAARWKKFKKPVIVGEHGNLDNRNPTSRPATAGGTWDPNSPMRMRVRNWSALFNEISFVFWNTSYAKDGHNMNIWLGPREREYVRAMQDFAYTLGGGLHMAPSAVSNRSLAKSYALANDRRVGIYIHQFKNDPKPISDLRVTVEVPQSAKGYWYSTETAAILKTIDVPAGRPTLEVPQFLVDIALLITPDGPPDIDKDGIPTDVDNDNDNDGVTNDKDAFPLEPEEWADKDGDLIGDNLDADKNGDGIGDDDNHNGVPDCQEMDIDGDGVPRANVVPWDAFPQDPKEWRDTDGDGIGDNADTDKDGDGFSEQEEIKAGTDPLNKLSFPVERASR